MPSTTQPAERDATMSSPTPPPPPPLQISPGARATALQKVFNEALKHTLRTCSYDNFAACFPTPAQHCPSSLRALWSQMTQKMDELARSEFDDILRERNVIPSLNELDRLVADAKKRKARATEEEDPIPPHTLPAEAILAAHLAPFLAQQQSQLNAKIQTAQCENAALMETIQAQREEIRRLVDGLETMVEDLEAAAVEVETAVRDGRVARDIDEMERELLAARPTTS
ncbi:MAG: hypothetical protein M1825_006363 [Sarcosagium campestre]|nr:MAG: hypothetical protein M1825_006363 [Sarcosagium campestre]